VYVWTKKAEQHYRQRHPHRKNEWKAGTPALWYGKELSKSFVEGYAERGWIAEIVESKKKAAKTTAEARRIAKEEERARKWKKLIELFGAPNKYSMCDIAVELGYGSDSTVSGFVRNYGIELSQKYGKLPYKEGLKMKVWTEVMEGKA
jgi:hypothetical protein